MDLLLAGQVTEIVTAFMLVAVVAMLYYFGRHYYIKDLLFAFSAYLTVLILSLTGEYYLSQVLSNTMIFVLLLVTSYYLAKSLFDQEHRRFPIRLQIAYTVFTFAATSSLFFFDILGLSEGIGYIFVGITFIGTGVGWIRKGPLKSLGGKLIGLFFLLLGVHLIDFLWVQYEGSMLFIGYALAALFEIALTWLIVFSYFSELYLSNARNLNQYKLLFENSSDPILIIENRLLVDCNENACLLFNAPKRDLVGKTPMALSPEYQENGRLTQEYGLELFSRASAGKTTHFDWIHLTSDGQEVQCEISLFLLEENKYAAILRDMTDKYRHEEELNFHRYYDGLTHLPKRTLFMDRLKIYLEERYQRVALIAINIDQFKEINDEYGHEAGDHLLVDVSERLQNIFRTEVTITRIGGDEFILIMDHLVHRNRIYLPIERISSCFESPYIIAGHNVTISVCMGVAYAENSSMDANTLLSNVDLALNLAKKNGRGKTEFFSEVGKKEFGNRITLEREIRNGIDNGEFIPYYQPIVDTVTEKVIGAEALMRWKKADGSMVYPDVFIPVSEETELIKIMGLDILRQACVDCNRILKDYPDFTIHVNLSPFQLEDEAIVREIMNILRETGLPARHLEVELTESAFIADEKHVNNLLKQIRDLGVLVALDDFGTGYSSLSYLSNMNVDTIKIDRSFVIHVPTRRRPTSMLQGITALIHDLDYKIIAEGVEDLDQVEFLRDLGCDAIQGYYYYKPMPYEDLLLLDDLGDIR